MPETKSKAPRIEQVENLLKAINQPYATFEQVASLTKALIQSVNKVKETLQTENLSNKEQILGEVNAIVGVVVQNYNSAVSELKKNEKNTKKSIESLGRELKQLIKDTESKIPDTTYLRLKIEEIDEREVAEYDDSAIIEGLDYLEERIEEVEEKINRVKVKATGAGGSGILNIGHWPRHESFTMNGSDTTVTLTQAVAANGTALIVRYQGQTLDLTTHYTVSGNKITLVGFTPEADTIISVTYWT